MLVVAYSNCTFRADDVDGNGDLTVGASELGLAPGVQPPDVLDVECHPGVVRHFHLAGREVAGESVVGWSYWEDDATYDPDRPCVNFRVLND